MIGDDIEESVDCKRKKAHIVNVTAHLESCYLHVTHAL
jgi:hypothetical protein